MDLDGAVQNECKDQVRVKFRPQYQELLLFQYLMYLSLYYPTYSSAGLGGMGWGFDNILYAQPHSRGYPPQSSTVKRLTNPIQSPTYT